MTWKNKVVIWQTVIVNLISQRPEIKKKVGLNVAFQSSLRWLDKTLVGKGMETVHM